MTQSHTLNVKLSNSQVNKFKSEIKKWNFEIIYLIECHLMR